MACRAGQHPRGGPTPVAIADDGHVNRMCRQQTGFQADLSSDGLHEHDRFSAATLRNVLCITKSKAKKISLYRSLVARINASMWSRYRSSAFRPAAVSRYSVFGKRPSNDFEHKM